MEPFPLEMRKQAREKAIQKVVAKSEFEPKSAPNTVATWCPGAGCHSTKEGILGI
jgi:hypothetical protein